MIIVIIPVLFLMLVSAVKKVPLIGGNLIAAFIGTGVLALLLGGVYNPVVWAQARAERLAAKRRAGTAPRWEFSFSWLVLGAFLRGETFCRKIRPAVLPAWAEFPGESNISSGVFRRASAFSLPEA